MRSCRSKNPNCWLLRRADLAYLFGIDTVPGRGAAMEVVLLGRQARIEHTDLHRPSGARLFRVIFPQAVQHA